MELYDKRKVIDYIWQYSRFYGNKLGDCEYHYEKGEGYVAIILLFEVAENICKSVFGDYNGNFNSIVSKLKDSGKITAVEEGFLSTNEFSIRRIRNLFAHANLAGIHIVQEENGREIYYPLTEEDSCLLLYEKVSHLLMNLLLKVIAESFVSEINIDLEDELREFEVRIENLSARKMLEMLGYPDDHIKSVENTIDEEKLKRLAENSSNVNVLMEILKNLK